VVSIEWQTFLTVRGKQIEANIGILFQDKSGKDNGTSIVGLKVTHAWPFVVGFISPLRHQQEKDIEKTKAITLERTV